MRTIFVLLALLLAAPAWAIDTVTCADADGAMSFEYDLDYKAVPPIVRVEMQLTDDFGFSTNPDSPKYDGEFVSAGFHHDDFEGGDVSYQLEGEYPRLAMSFRIGRASHGAFFAIGGVVSVGGGGVWVVECQSSDYGKSGG